MLIPFGGLSEWHLPKAGVGDRLYWFLTAPAQLITANVPRGVRCFDFDLPPASKGRRTPLAQNFHDSPTEARIRASSVYLSHLIRFPKSTRTLRPLDLPRLFLAVLGKAGLLTTRLSTAITTVTLS